MARFLILYASNTGNTAYAADYLGQAFQNQHSATCINVANLPSTTLPEFDVLLLGSSTWNDVQAGRVKEGQLHDQMRSFLDKHSPLRAKLPVSFFVLGDSAYKYFCGAAVMMQRYIRQSQAHLVAEPLLIDGYPQFQAEALDQWAATVSQQWHELRLANV